MSVNAGAIVRSADAPSPASGPAIARREQVRREAGRDRDDDHAPVEAADGVGSGERDQPQQEVEAGRLRCEDVLAELLPVLESVDARQVDALVVVGVGADEPAEEQRLRDDERREGEPFQNERSRP